MPAKKYPYCLKCGAAKHPYRGRCYACKPLRRTGFKPEPRQGTKPDSTKGVRGKISKSRTNKREQIRQRNNCMLEAAILLQQLHGAIIQKTIGLNATFEITNHPLIAEVLDIIPELLAKIEKWHMYVKPRKYKGRTYSPVAKEQFAWRKKKTKDRDDLAADT